MSQHQTTGRFIPFTRTDPLREMRFKALKSIGWTVLACVLAGLALRLAERF